MLKMRSRSRGNAQAARYHPSPPIAHIAKTHCGDDQRQRQSHACPFKLTASSKCIRIKSNTKSVFFLKQLITARGRGNYIIHNIYILVVLPTNKLCLPVSHRCISPNTAIATKEAGPGSILDQHFHSGDA